MRILFAGATGVLGRATLPHLGEHEVVGLTRSAEKAGELRAAGVAAAVCDVLDHEALVRLARSVEPDTVVNFVTDLSGRDMAANNRARREGGANLLRAATASGASRLVVESVAFPLEGDAALALEELERSTHGFVGEALVLRFGRLWGPHTFHETPPAPPAVSTEEAGVEAARLLVYASPGTYVVA